FAERERRAPELARCYSRRMCEFPLRNVLTNKANRSPDVQLVLVRQEDARPAGARQSAGPGRARWKKLRDFRSRPAPLRSNRRDEARALFSPTRFDSDKYSPQCARPSAPAAPCRKIEIILKNFDKNHLAKVLLGRSARTMRADHFCDQRIKLP